MRVAMLRLRQSSASLHSGSALHDTVLNSQKTGHTISQPHLRPSMLREAGSIPQTSPTRAVPANGRV